MLKKLIGSLCLLGFQGLHIPAYIKTLIQEYALTGAILFKDNIESPEQLRALNQSLHAQAQASAYKFILSVDHEGGRVFRLPAPFTKTPPLGDLVKSTEALDLNQEVLKLARTLATELKEVGFNLNYAPVCDVHSNPANPIIGDRAWSGDPQQVAELSSLFLNVMQAESVWGCAKHFPGHGDTSEDSHLALPIVHKSEADLRVCELIPFQLMIETGVDWIMTAHVLYPALDPQWPATLSSKILTDLLRKEMKYEGLIISDDLVMKGISEKYSIPEAAELFLRAGGDIVLICHQEKDQLATIEHLIHVAEKDSGFKNSLLEKQQRLLKVKQRMGLF